MKTLLLFVPGEPKAQPRPKARRAGNHVSIYTPASAKAWKQAIMLQYQGLKPGRQTRFAKDVALHVELNFHMPRPKSHFLKSGLRHNAPSWHTKRPDCDNLAKAVLDALQDAQAFHEDSQVALLSVTKQYAKEDDCPGCLIQIYEMSNNVKKPK